MKNFETFSTDFGAATHNSRPSGGRAARRGEDERLPAMLAAYKAGEMERAYGFARAILVTDPDHPQALRHAARIAWRWKRPEEARAAWQKLSRQSPHEPEPHLQLARIASREGAWAECLRHARALLLLDADHGEGRLFEARCLAETDPQGSFPTAFAKLCRTDGEAAFRLATGILDSPAEAPALRVLARARRANVRAIARRLFLAQRDAAMLAEVAAEPLPAAACYGRMLVLKPRSAYAQSGLTRVHRSVFEQARSAYRRKAYAALEDHAALCIRIDPTRPEPYILAGRAKADMGKLTEALDLFSEGLLACPFDGWLALNHARVAARLDQPLLAARSYARVLDAGDRKSVELHDEAREKLAALRPQLRRLRVADALSLARPAPTIRDFQPLPAGTSSQRPANSASARAL